MEGDKEGEKQRNTYTFIGGKNLKYLGFMQRIKSIRMKIYVGYS